MALFNLLWLSPTTFTASPTLKWTELKLQVQGWQKVDENGKSKTLFGKNIFIIWARSNCVMVCPVLYLGEGRAPGHSFISNLTLGSHNLFVHRVIYILIYYTIFALKRSLTNPLYWGRTITLKAEKTSEFSPSFIPTKACLSSLAHSLALHFLTLSQSLWTIRFLSQPPLSYCTNDDH